MNSDTVLHTGDTRGNVVGDLWMQPAGVFCLIVGILAFVLNLGVIIIMTMDEKVRHDSYCTLILNLSVSDLLVGTSMISYLGTFFVTGGRSKAICFFPLLALFISASVTNMHVLTVCAFRLLAIKFPMKFRKYYKLRNVAAGVAVIWILTACEFIVPSLYLYGNLTDIIPVCVIPMVFNPSEYIFLLYSLDSLLRYTCVFIAFMCLVISLNHRRVAPGVVRVRNTNSSGGSGIEIPTRHGTASSHEAHRQNNLTVFDVNVVHAPTRLARAVRSPIDTAPNVQRRISHVDSVRQLAIIVGVLTVCVIPASITLLIDALSTDTEISVTLRACFVGLSAANSLINPIVYAIRMAKFKEAIKRRFRLFGIRS